MVGGDDGKTGLWSGVDDAPEPTGGVKERQPAPDDDPIPDPATMTLQMLRRFFSNVTPGQAHAAMAGFIPWFVAIVTGELALLTIAFGVTSIALGHDHLPTRLIGITVRSPTFCVGGAALGWTVGALVLAAVQVVRTAIGVVP